MIFEEVD